MIYEYNRITEEQERAALAALREMETEAGLGHSRSDRDLLGDTASCCHVDFEDLLAGLADGDPRYVLDARSTFGLAL
jgi:hypothetical protein